VVSFVSFKRSTPLMEMVAVETQPTGWPKPSSSWPIQDTTVDFPFVPVTAMTVNRRAGQP
jgi:hypothetical protein